MKNQLLLIFAAAAIVSGENTFAQGSNIDRFYRGFFATNPAKQVVDACDSSIRRSAREALGDAQVQRLLHAIEREVGRTPQLKVDAVIYPTYSAPFFQAHVARDLPFEDEVKRNPCNIESWGDVWLRAQLGLCTTLPSRESSWTTTSVLGVPENANPLASEEVKKPVPGRRFRGMQKSVLSIVWAPRSGNSGNEVVTQASVGPFQNDRLADCKVSPQKVAEMLSRIRSDAASKRPQTFETDSRSKGSAQRGMPASRENARGSASGSAR